MRYAAFFLASLLLTVAPDTPNLDVITQNGMDCGLEGKPGGSPAQKDLNRHKNRYNDPTDSDIAPEASLAAMLAPGQDVNRFNQEKAATIRGFVISVKVGGVESCNCETKVPDERDTHIELGLAAGVPEIQRVIVEVTPRLRLLKQKKDIDWKTDTLRGQIQGKWVEVTGWLLFDTAHIDQAENTNPGGSTNWRATCWEIHPVTNITILESAPAELKEFQPASMAALQSVHAAHLDRVPNGKAAFKKIQDEYLSKFSEDEKKEARDEGEEHRKRP